MKKKKAEDKSDLAIGGGALIGLGAGFVLLPTSPLLFLASILIGVGTGLVVTAIITHRK